MLQPPPVVPMCCLVNFTQGNRKRQVIKMPLPWYYQERLLNDRPAELRLEAENERRAKQARGDQVSDPVLPRLFSSLIGKIGTLQQQLVSFASKSKTLAAQRLSYLDNPDPFRDCATC